MNALSIESRSLALATRLTGFQIVDAISPLEVIAALNRIGASFVLVGAYGLASWTKDPRATQDVDLVLAAKHHRKATRELLATFDNLEADEQEVVTRLKDKTTHEVAIDLIKPRDLYRAAFKHTTRATLQGHSYRIPSLETALAMKFAAMIRLVRAEEKRLVDASDFIKIVKANATIDLEGLARLGELVYPGGGGEVVELVQKVRAGIRLQF